MKGVWSVGALSSLHPAGLGRGAFPHLALGNSEGETLLKCQTVRSVGLQ